MDVEMLRYALLIYQFRYSGSITSPQTRFPAPLFNQSVIPRLEPARCLQPTFDRIKSTEGMPGVEKRVARSTVLFPNQPCP
jgi:hypothetical protein